MNSISILYWILACVLISMCQLILMVKQQNSSAPPTKICFIRLCCNFCGFVLHCQHDSFPDPSCNFHSFVHDFSQGPSSNSHGSMQHYHRDSSPSRSCNFRSFVLHCQHDSFWILHVTFVASCTSFLRVFHVAVTASCCTVSTALL